MCGILGRWNFGKPIDKEVFNRMRDTLIHRGPDGFGTWIHDNGNLALGHRRLSFLDLSSAGAQPICNENKSIWLTVNGEIYNYLELREELRNKGHVFKSDTDSEVIVHAWEEWGTEMLPRLEGMFAFGLWDENRKELILARDRYGIKPLYYCLNNNEMLFASELKAFAADPGIPRVIDPAAFCNYFTYRYIPSPQTIYKNIYKLEPGQCAVFKTQGDFSLSFYFSPATDNVKMGINEAAEIAGELLHSSVRRHIRSDVPVGSFLSGGYDSSALVKYFSKEQPGFNTFSAGFEGWDLSEHHFANKVSSVYETQSHELIIGTNDYEVLPELMFNYDEPIADISIIPTYLISRLAAAHNKTVLSGEGADEIFAGYTWHRPYLWDITKKQLREARKYHWEIPANRYDVESYSRAMAMGMFRHSDFKEFISPEWYQYIPEDTWWFYRKHYDNSLPAPKSFQLLDIRTFMGELVLTKIDRASMAHSLEVRVPFLDNKLVDFMLSLDPDVYFSLKKQKVLLYKLLKKDLPKQILQRKKQGFVGPDDYYKNIQFYTHYLGESMLSKAGVVNQNYINKLMSEGDYWRLWKICIMELWWRKWNPSID